MVMTQRKTHLVDLAIKSRQPEFIAILTQDKVYETLCMVQYTVQWRKICKRFICGMYM